MSHLDVLGLPFDARLDDIKAAYRSLAKTCHPDLFPDDAVAHERFRAIKHAYDSLMEQWSSRDRDIGSGGRKPPPVLRTTVKLTVTQLLAGSEIELDEAVSDCTYCKGRGAIKSDRLVDCTWCMGKGYTYAEKGIIRLKVECVPCSGTGKTHWYPCGHCGATGINGGGHGHIHIPPNTLPGSELVFSGKALDPKTGSPCDLVVLVDLKDDQFVVDGFDIETRLRLHLSDLVLGCRHKLKHPNGRPFEVTIKPGTFPGKVLHMKGHGFSLDDIAGEFRIVLEAQPLNLNDPEVVRALQALKART